MNDAELQEKRERSAQLYREIRDEEDRRKAEDLFPDRKKWEGLWKFRNCFSCPQTDADYWWLYAKVSNVTKDGYLDMVKFQIDKEGRLDVRQENRMPWEMLTEDWVRATEAEWREAAMQAKAIADRLVS